MARLRRRRCRRVFPAACRGGVATATPRLCRRRCRRALSAACRGGVATATPRRRFPSRCWCRDADFQALTPPCPPRCLLWQRVCSGRVVAVGAPFHSVPNALFVVVAWRVCGGLSAAILPPLCVLKVLCGVAGVAAVVSALFFVLVARLLGQWCSLSCANLLSPWCILSCLRGVTVEDWPPHAPLSLLAVAAC